MTAAAALAARLMFRRYRARPYSPALPTLAQPFPSFSVPSTHHSSPLLLNPFAGKPKSAIARVIPLPHSRTLIAPALFSSLRSFLARVLIHGWKLYVLSKP